MNIEQYTDIKRYNTLAKKINEVVKELYNFEKQFNDYKDGIEELKKGLIDDVEDSTQNFENIINNKLNNLEHYENEFNNVETKNIEQDKRLVDIEKKNKVQDVYVQGLFNENKDGRLTLEGEGNSLKLEGSKEGLVDVNKVVGNTLVNLVPNFNSWKLTNGSSIIDGGRTLQVDATDWNRGASIRINRSFNGSYLLSVKNIFETTDATIAINDSNNIQIYKGNVDGVMVINTNTEYLDIVIKNSSQKGSFKVSDFIVIEGSDVNNFKPTKYFEGMKSTFEDKLVTQEMVDSGEESVENLGKYKVDVKVRGKNLFNPNDVLLGKYQNYDSVTNTWDISNNDNFKTIQIYNLKPNTQYYVRAGIWTVYNSNDECLKTTLTSFNGVLTTPGYVCNLKTSVVITDDLTNYQVEEGTQTTSYEPYYERTQTVYLNNPLLKGDEIVYKEDGLYHYHNMGKVVLDENTKVTHNGDVGDVSEYLIGEESDLFDNSSPTNLLCDKFMVGQPSNNSQSIFLVGKRIRLRLFTKDYPNSASVINYLTSNNVKVLFKLKEPYFEKISDDKLLLEIPNNATVSVKSLVPINNITTTYTHNIPNIYEMKKTDKLQDDIIDTTLLATDELYNMIEPLLYMIPQTIPLNSESKMVEFYYIMYIRKLKTIDEIPQRYKILVKEKIKGVDINVN